MRLPLAAISRMKKKAKVDMLVPLSKAGQGDIGVSFKGETPAYHTFMSYPMEKPYMSDIGVPF